MKRIITTEHYTFELDIRKDTTGPISTYILTVGDKEKPCLNAIIPLKPIKTNNQEKFYNFIKYATLPNIEALHECLYENVTNKYFETYSFGVEMLQSLIRTIKNIKEFEHITHIKLTDKSYIPCNRALNDTLDLITYNIALYGKTWYELNFSATAFPDINTNINNNNSNATNEEYKNYRNAIKKYLSATTKDKTTFDELHAFISINNKYASAYINDHLGNIKNLYDESKTFPDFFIKLSKQIERTNKCRFFKTWLEDFIASRIPIRRTWYIPIRRSGKSGGFKTRKLSAKPILRD